MCVHSNSTMCMHSVSTMCVHSNSTTCMHSASTMCVHNVSNMCVHSVSAMCVHSQALQRHPSRFSCSCEPWYIYSKLVTPGFINTPPLLHRLGPSSTFQKYSTLPRRRDHSHSNFPSVFAITIQNFVHNKLRAQSGGGVEKSNEYESIVSFGI